MAGTTFNPSWSDSVKWESPAGDKGFGGGVSPGSSFEPPSGFPSAGDAGFWKNQPTDENYYNKGKFDPKNFLDAFAKGLGEDKNKYQNQAQQSGSQSGGRGDTSGGSVGKIAPDVSIYTPPTPYAPFTVAGMPGEKGKGGVIGQIAGTALGFALGGPAGASLGGSLGGAAGSFFG